MYEQATTTANWGAFAASQEGARPAIPAKLRRFFLGALAALIPLSRVIRFGDKEVNAAASDIVLAAGIVLMLVMALRGQLRLPYAGRAFLVLAAMGLSVFVNLNDALVIKGPTAILLEMFKNFLGWVYLYMIVNFASERDDLKLCLKVWCLAAGASALTGIYGSLAFQFTHMRTPFADWYRANGTFNDANLFAVHMGATFFLTLALRHLSARPPFWTIPLLGVLAAGVFYSASRGAMLSVALGLCIGFVVGFSWKWRLVSLFLVLGAAVVFLSMPNREHLLKSNPITSRLSTTTVSLESRESAERAALWRLAWEGFSRKPWLGIGRGNFFVLNMRDPHRIGDVHNTYLGYLCEQGLIGTSLLGVFLLPFAWTLVKNWMLHAGEPSGFAAASLALAWLVIGLGAVTLSLENYRAWWALLGVIEVWRRTHMQQVELPDAAAEPAVKPGIAAGRGSLAHA